MDSSVQEYTEAREHHPHEWQDLCIATERELQRRGCVECTTTAAELLAEGRIKQSFLARDYYRDGSARPHRSLRRAKVAGEWVESDKQIARRLCDTWQDGTSQAPQPQERSTGTADHGRPESGAQTHGAGAAGNVQQPVSTGQGSLGQGGERDHMEQVLKRRRTTGMSISEVNEIDSVRKLFNKTVATLFDFHYPRNQQVAKWVINAKVMQVEKREYPSTGHSGEFYITFSDNTIRPVKGLIHAATKLAELADREAAQKPSFQWTAAQKQLPLYSVLHQVHPSLDDVLAADPRQGQGESMEQGIDSSAPAGAEHASTPPQERQAPDRAEWQTLSTLKAKTKELRSQMDKLKAELVAAQQGRDMLQAGLPDEEESASRMKTLVEKAEQAEATLKRKRQDAVDAEAACNRSKQEATHAEAAWNKIRQEADGIEASSLQAGAALAAKVAEVERLREATDTTERQLATAHQSVLKFF